MTMWASPEEIQESCPLPNFMCGGVGVPTERPLGAAVYADEHWYRCRKCGTLYSVYRSEAS